VFNNNATSMNMLQLHSTARAISMDKLQLWNINYLNENKMDKRTKGLSENFGPNRSNVDYSDTTNKLIIVYGKTYIQLYCLSSSVLYSLYLRIMDAACTSPSSSLTAFFLGGNHHQGRRSKVQPSPPAKEEGEEGMSFILDKDQQQQVYFR
jgi:hypothetical protein